MGLHQDLLDKLRVIASDLSEEDVAKLQEIALSLATPLPEPLPPPFPSPGVDVNKIFTYHPPRPDQVPRYEEIRARALDFAIYIVTHTPGSAEQTLAIRDLQRCVMMANAAIAINEADGG